MKIFKHKWMQFILLILAGLGAGCENYIGDEVLIPNIDLPSSGQFLLQANLTTADSIFALRTDRGSNVFSGLSWDFIGQNRWPVVDESDLDIRLFNSDDTELLHFDYIPRDERIFNSGIPFDTISGSFPGYTAENNYRARFMTNPLRSGETYRLQVDHPELGVFDVFQTVPFSLESGQIELGNRYEIPLFGGSLIRQPLNVTLSVSPRQKQFYAIQILQYRNDSDNFDSGNNNIETTDPRIIFFDQETTGFGRTVFLKIGEDNTDESVSFTIDAELAFAQSGFSIAGIVITSISSEWYDFTASLIRFRELYPQLNEGFVEPFQLYTNVSNGFGCFGVGYVDTIFVD